MLVVAVGGVRRVIRWGGEVHGQAFLWLGGGGLGFEGVGLQCCVFARRLWA